MTRRPLKVRMTIRPAPEATDDPDALARQVVDWLTGRSNRVPTLKASTTS